MCADRTSRAPGAKDARKEAAPEGGFTLRLLGFLALSALRGGYGPRSGGAARGAHRRFRPSPPPEVVREQERKPPEAPGVSARGVVAVAFGFILFVFAVIGGLFAYWTSGVSGPLIFSRRDFPGPGLQYDPRSDLERFLAQQRKQLEGYSWVDKDKGLVSIPIERAMELVTKRGPQALEPLEGPAVPPGPIRGTGGAAARGSRQQRGPEAQGAPDPQSSEALEPSGPAGVPR